MFPHNFVFFFFAAWFAPVFSFLTAWKEHAIIAVNCMSTTPTDIYAFDGYLVSTVSSYQCTMLPKQVEQVFKQWEAPLFMSRLHCMHMTVLPSQLFLVIVIFFSAESKYFCWVIWSLWPISSTNFLGAIYMMFAIFWWLHRCLFFRRSLMTVLQLLKCFCSLFLAVPLTNYFHFPAWF